MQHDVVIAGGSVAGLICAREIGARGHSVLVIEDDYEIGTPEHCGGLISMAGLKQLGIIPLRKTLGHKIESAQIFAPDGNSFVVNSSKQQVVEINRREMDKQIAQQAQKNGAEIMVRTSFKEITKDSIKTSRGEIGYKIFVDARGISSLAQKDRTGIIPSAQYEVHASWIKGNNVKVYLDQEKYPEFFAWIIPSEEGRGKIGVAGRGINVSDALDKFLDSRKKCSVIRKIYAPIWINGPIKKFVEGNTVIVGDAAGQAKPTTAGGIYSSGMGGQFAGRAISEFLDTGDRAKLKQYQKDWKNIFGREFERQLITRRILKGISNSTINRMCRAITPEIIKQISEKDDFDFHGETITKLIVNKDTVNMLRMLASGKISDMLRRS